LTVYLFTCFFFVFGFGFLFYQAFLVEFVAEELYFTSTLEQISSYSLHLLCKPATGCTRTHPFNSPLFRTTRVSQYQKGKTNLDFTEARDSEWQWHQLGHMQVCTSLQTNNHASTPPLRFLQAGCPSCRPTNSVKALKG